VRILMCSVHGDGVWFVHTLAKAGHDVSWVVSSERDADTLQGLVPPPLSKAPNPSDYDLIVFDSSGLGEAADLARQVTPTIGGSRLADALESDRIFGIEAMEHAGIPVPEWEAFDTPAAAVAWLKKNQKRTVLKPIGDAPSDATYVSKSSEDMIQYIETRLHAKVKSFILQEHVVGTEVSTEAWWTGDSWVALNHTLEEKKLMTGGIGPNTGCAGNVLWMPDKPNQLFERGLAKIGPMLKEAGFVGMIDLNTIVTEGEVYGLEWTPRFGYEGTCNLTRLLPIEFGEFLFAVATGSATTLAQPRARFSATIRLSVPPYPSAEFSRRKDNVPVRGVDLDHLESFVLYDVKLDGEELVTGGTYQCIGSPIGCGETIGGAFDEVESVIHRLDVPNLQWRNDISRCVEKRYGMLRECGWLRPIG
jgi:phosphoribosylamine---glycine ligase